MSTTQERLRSILNRIMGKNVIVIGDLILDHYVETTNVKLAREAPIPVSKIVNEYFYAGGAGNLAVNIATLGGNVHVVGTVGNEYEGEKLIDILNKNNINTSIIKIDRKTSVHTRYYLDKHIYLRIDKEDTKDLNKDIVDRLYSNVKSIVNKGGIDCICVSDYDKGTITPRLLRYLVSLSRDRNIPIYGQPMIKHYLDFIGFTAIKSNMKEASKVIGISILNESSLHNLGIHLLNRLSCKYLILTTGKKGLTVFEENSITTIPSLISSKDFKRSIGIRDAMTAILALALCAGADVVDAAILSNIAAAIAIPGMHTVILTKKDFESYIDKFTTKIVNRVPLYR